MIKPDVEGVATSYEELLEHAPPHRGLAAGANLLQVLGVLNLAGAVLLGIVLGVTAAAAETAETGVLAMVFLLGPAIGLFIGGIVLIVLGALVDAVRSIARDQHVTARAAATVDGGFMSAKQRLELRKKKVKG